MGPRDYGTTGLRDDRTTGPWDNGTTGQQDYGTMGPRTIGDGQQDAYELGHRRMPEARAPVGFHPSTRSNEPMHGVDGL